MNLVISMYSSKYQEDNDNFDYFKCITWSPYERIEVKPVVSFKELCKGGVSQINDQRKGQTWTGVKQCLHLIGIDGKENEFSLTNDNIGDCVFNTSDNQKNYNFYCVLSMRFDPVIHTMHKVGSNSEDEQLINRIKEKTVKIVNGSLIDSVVCASFRSLGAEDLVMIFLSNSIKDMMRVVDSARNIQFKYNSETIDLFSTVYMFTGLNNPNCVEEMGVNLIVNLHLKKHNMNEIEYKLNQVIPGKVEYKEIFRGKGTVQLEIPGSIKVDTLFKDKEGILSENSSFYKNNFYGSRVYFKEETDSQFVPQSIDEGSEWRTDDELGENDILDNAGLANETNDFDEMTDVARFIFGEYERIKANSRFCQWKKILNEHHNTTLRFVKEYMKYDRLVECRLLEQMQASLHLINQACSPASDIPYHNYYYSGSFSDLLKAYYGIINMLFNIIYELPHVENTFQHKLVFAIRLEAIARIQSEMFTLKSSSDRIIVFSLPYDSFWNYANNIKLLAHEAFHYAAPYDRIQRNQGVLNIIFKMLLTNHAQNVSDKYLNNIPCSNFSQETRMWSGYMLNAFRNDAEFKYEFYNELYNKYESFFSSAAPEWGVIFCKNKNLDRIVCATASYVQKFIDDKNTDAKAHVKNILHDFKLEDLFIKTRLEEPDKAMCSRIITTISNINTAVKEAFCDIWSIKITKISVSEYILWLFEVMVDIKNPQWIRTALAFDYPNLNIRLFSMVIRMYLLLYFDFNEKHGKRFDPGAALRNCVKNSYPSKTSDDLSECIRVLAQFLDKKETIFTIFRDELYNMAFKNLYEYFSQAQFTENKDVIALGEIYRNDLSNTVNEDSLNRLVFYTPERLSSKNGTSFNSSGHVSLFSMDYVRTLRDYDNEDNTPYMITSLADYMACLSDIYSINRPNLESHKLWYRGICNIEFSLLPSLFRNCDDSVSLYANQSNIMKKAYFNSTASTELWNQPIQQRMASLQHYGVPTNLLDFSLDQFVALHFAVNPDRESDRNAIDEGRFRPVVYVFNPIEFSRAIECLKSGNQNKAHTFNLSPVLFDFNQNDEERERYFVGDMSYEHLVWHTNRYNTTDYIPDPRANLYPVPIVIEHTNPRIKAQSGVFIAYPLDASPQSGVVGEERYKYVDLQQIQNQYNKLIKSHQINGPFLFTIEVRKTAINSIREQLKQFNINSGKFYPELFKLFENMKD